MWRKALCCVFLFFPRMSWLTQMITIMLREFIVPTYSTMAVLTNTWKHPHFKVRPLENSTFIWNHFFSKTFLHPFQEFQRLEKIKGPNGGIFSTLFISMPGINDSCKICLLVVLLIGSGFLLAPSTEKILEKKENIQTEVLVKQLVFPSEDKEGKSKPQSSLVVGLQC